MSGVHYDHEHEGQPQHQMLTARHLHEWNVALGGAREREEQIAAGRRSRSSRRSSSSGNSRRRSSAASGGAGGGGSGSSLGMRSAAEARRGSIVRLQEMLEAQKRRQSGGSNTA